MRDIVATIQPDQDDIVRAPLASRSACRERRAPARPPSACTGPPICSTRTRGSCALRRPRRRAQPGVPALHRAGAAHPRRGRRRPDHGGRATGRVTVRAVDPRTSPSSRATPRMAEVLRRALWGEIAKPADSLQVPLAGRRYRVPVERLKRYVDDVRRRGRAEDDQQLLHYAAGRERLAMLLAEDARRQKEEAGGSPSDAETRRAARSRRGACVLRRGVAGPRRRRPGLRAVLRPRAAGPGRPRDPRRGRAGAAALAAAAALGQAPRAGPPPTRSSSTRPPGCSSGPTATGTSCSTRRRTSHPWSAARWRGGSRPAR